MSKSLNECTSDCNNCGASCTGSSYVLKSPHRLSSIKKIIGISSGKGGAGKSLVTSLLAVQMKQKGFKVGILDADITGPSIPKIFGIKERALVTELGIIPARSSTGIEIMSSNLLIENETDPVALRGPIVGNLVTSFYTDVIWRDIDYLFIDMPPGTGDVALFIYQSIPVDGIIVVSTPSMLTQMIVEKAINMANLMDIKILGMVLNFASFICPDCNKEHTIFGLEKATDITIKYTIPLVSTIPIDPKLSAACDQGLIELFDGNLLSDTSNMLGKMLED